MGLPRKLFRRHRSDKDLARRSAGHDAPSTPTPYRAQPSASGSEENLSKLESSPPQLKLSPDHSSVLTVREAADPTHPVGDIDSKIEQMKSKVAPRVQDYVDRFVRGKSTDRDRAASADSAAAASSDMPATPKEHSLGESHIPSRTSSSRGRKITKTHNLQQYPSAPTTPDSRNPSSTDSVQSYETGASSMTDTLTAFQSKTTATSLGIYDIVNDDPKSFDLTEPSTPTEDDFSLERRSEQLLSKDHLKSIFGDADDLLGFTNFLTRHRQQSIPVLIYYLDALKALRALRYANAIAEALEPIRGYDFTEFPARPTQNAVLEEKARQAFDVMVERDLPAYVTHVIVQVVAANVQRWITGAVPPHLGEMSEGLGEVFCLTDPSRPENPIVFASREFHRTTQYGVSHVMGRNCRFLQGSRTNPDSARRLGDAVAAGQTHTELVLNYRRDGSPFMNLVMVAPLLDNRGNLRYYLGAQVDVSQLIAECTELAALQRMLEKQESKEAREKGEDNEAEKPDELQDLCEMFNTTELDTVRNVGGRMHRQPVRSTGTSDQHSQDDCIAHQPRLHTKVPRRNLHHSFHCSSTDTNPPSIYKHYLLVRPHPSLRILFTSPSLRVPGLLQSPFLEHIAGTPRVRAELIVALAAGRGVTAKIRWIAGRNWDPQEHTESKRSQESGKTGPDGKARTKADEGRPRWIHCTPLYGAGGKVGVWVVVLVDDESSTRRKALGREAPPIAGGARGCPLAAPAEILGEPARQRPRRSSMFSETGLGGDDEGPRATGAWHESLYAMPNGGHRPASSSGMASQRPVSSGRGMRPSSSHAFGTDFSVLQSFHL